MVRMRFPVALLSVIIACGSAQSQWQIQNSRTTASLRGIHALSSEVAWASGTSGTVLRTTDGGTTWLSCTTPPNAEKLDFRGIQAFDQNTAIVMSSGKGDLSRLYKTTDGCRTWKLLFTNPDKKGFWDAIQTADTIPKADGTTFILGDPVHGQFRFFENDPDDVDPVFPSPTNTEVPWTDLRQKGLEANPETRGAFAASNTALNTGDALNIFPFFGTGGPDGAFVFFNTGMGGGSAPHGGTIEPQSRYWRRVPVPVGNRTKSSGIFSLACRASKDQNGRIRRRWIVAVGGDYQHPDKNRNTAASSIDGGLHWIAAKTPPHGYRSAVAYDSKTKTWLTVGPNGTDISRDDGRNWTALKPTAQGPPDADKNWNALSLPFVVGPKGRIGKLNARTLTP